MDDYKQLCIELINELNGYKVAHPQHDTELIDRARAALAEPEPEGPTHTELSPSAQAVLDAFDNASDGEYVDGVWVVNERAMLAAALRAVADQVVPPEQQTPWGSVVQAHAGELRIRNELLAIANELEAQ